MFDGLPGASCPQPDLFKGFAADEIGADAVENHRGAQPDLFEAAAIGNPDECAAEDFACSLNAFVAVWERFQKIYGMAAVSVPQIILYRNGLASIHGRHNGPQNDGVLPPVGDNVSEIRRIQESFQKKGHLT